MTLVPRINHIYHQETAVCWQQQYLAELSTVAVTLVLQSGNTFPNGMDTTGNQDVPDCSHGHLFEPE